MLLCYSFAYVGCTAGPDFQRPESPRSDRYLPERRHQMLDEGSEANITDSAIPERWWEMFGSPELDSLVVEALQKSPTLDAAKATLRAARYRQDAQAGSEDLPKISVADGASRQGTNLATMGQEGQERTFNLFDTFISAGYTLDLSGVNKRRLEALTATAEQKRHQFEAAKLKLVTNVVVTAIQLAELNDRLERVEAGVRLVTDKKSIEQKRLRLGGASRYEILQIEKEAGVLRAEIAVLRQQRDATATLLRLLCGREPAEGELPGLSVSDFRMPDKLPLRIPSELVRRRPDILAAEEMMRAANAEYGVKVAESYPRITLDAHIGSQSLSLAGLFGSASLLWGVGGNMVHSLFDGGRGAEKKAALAEFDLAAANYRQTVLEALRQVAVGLTSIDTDKAEFSARQDVSMALKDQYEIMEAKRRLGASSTLDLLTLSQEREVRSGELISSRSKRLIDSALLFQAMGG